MRANRESNMFRWATCLAVAAFLGAGITARAEAWSVGTPIVTYYAGPPLTDANARQMAEGGWNLVWANSLTELNVAQQHGLRAMWLGSLDDATVVQIRTHPALYAYYVIDEPSASQFAGYGATVARLRGLDPAHMAYINLFPTYASNQQLGTSGDTITAYAAYLSQYVSIVQPALISYDHYQFMVSGDTGQYFLNLAMVRQAALDAGVPFLNIVQAASWAPGVRVPNGDEMRFLVYTTLAYGAQGISYYVYYASGHAGGIALADGTPTALYTALRTINPEFAAIALQVQRLRSVGAYHLGDQPYGGIRLPGNSPFRISPNVPDTTYVWNTPVKGMLMGIFGPDAQLADATCALVVNLNYTAGKTCTVVGPGNLWVFNAATGAWSPAGGDSATLNLLPGGGTLVTVAPPPATKPSPADNATGVSPDTLLGWMPGLWPNSQNVYFGATPSLGAGQLLGNYSASTASVNPGILSGTTTYYWRVDGLDAGGSVMAQGPVWRFTTSPPRGRLQFKSVAYPVNENGGVRRVYVSRTGGSYGAASVGYATANGSAAAGSDYTALSGTLNWANGDSADKYATVTILDDLTGENSETFTVSLSGAGGASLGSPASTAVTIADNDPGPATNPSPAHNATGVAPHPVLTWTPGLRLSSQTVYFGATPSLGAGQLLGNYGASAASVDPGLLSGNTTYYWRVDGLDAGGAVVVQGPVWQFTIEPPRGSLQFKSVTYPVNENGVIRRVYVSRRGGSYGTASVGYATANGTATSGSDYTALSGTLNWADGDSADKFATIAILDDSTYEGNETFSVNLSGASLGSPASTTVTIADNDLRTATNPSPAHNATGVSLETLLGWIPGSPLNSQNVYFGTAPVPGAVQLLGNYSASTASVDPGTLSQGATYYWRVDGLDAGGAVVQGAVWLFTTDAARGSLQFKSATYTVSENGSICRVYVSRTGGSNGAASVGYATANGTATSGSDYTALSGTLNWADGDSADKYATVTILDDSTYEGNETFSVNLSGASGASLGSPAATTVTIADDDPGPATNPSPANNDMGVSPETLLGWTPGLRNSSQNVYFGTAPVPGAGQLLGNYSSSTASVDPGTLSGSTTYYWRVDGLNAGGAVAAQGPVWQFTIEPPRGSLQFKSATYPVYENGLIRRVYVSRTGGTYGAASVNYATANGSATAGSDYTALSGTLNWANGDSADKFGTVTILDDLTYEESETFAVALSGAGGASLGSPATAAVRITDNDPGPAANPSPAYHAAGVSAETLLGGTSGLSLSSQAQNLAAMGTPQWWLAAHGLTEPWDAAELSDQDHDGMAAWKEWWSDTDPANSNSVLRIFSIEPQPGGMRIRWQGGTGVLQYVESRGDLASPLDPWKAIYTNLPPTDVTNAVLDTGAAVGPRLYRIKAVR